MIGRKKFLAICFIEKIMFGRKLCSGENYIGQFAFSGINILLLMTMFCERDTPPVIWTANFLIYRVFNESPVVHAVRALVCDLF